MSNIELKLPTPTSDGCEILKKIENYKNSHIGCGFAKSDVKWSLASFDGFLEALLLLGVIDKSTHDQQFNEASTLANQRLTYIKSLK